MPCAQILRLGDRPEECRTEAGEVMSGVLEIIRGSPIVSKSSSGVNKPAENIASTSRLTQSCQKVFVRVYRTSSEHFAALYPIRAIVTACRPLASINLRSCTVKPLSGNSNREFRVSPRSCEGVSVTFRALEGSSEIQMAEWIQSFSDIQNAIHRRKISEHRSPLPVLEESEEDLAIEAQES